MAGKALIAEEQERSWPSGPRWRLPPEAWDAASDGSALFAPEWLFWAVVGVVVAGVGLLVFGARRLLARRTKKHNDARWASAHDERLMVVSDDPRSRPHRLVAGRSKSTGRCLAGEDCVSSVVFGPNGSGKTVGLIIPNVLEWRGSVVMTTAKPQDLMPVMAARSALGPVWVIAPGGAPGIDTRPGHRSTTPPTLMPQTVWRRGWSTPPG